MSRINTYESRKNYYRHLTRPNGEPLSEKDCLLLDLCCQWTKNNSIATSTYNYLLAEKFPKQNHPRTVKRTFDNISLYIKAEFKNIHVIYGVTHKDRIRIERVADFDLKMEEAKQKNQEKSSKKGVQKCLPSSTKMSTMVDRNVDPSTFIYKNTKKNTINDINDNHDHQENQFLKISEFSEEEISQEKSVCLETPKSLGTKQFVETDVKRLADESSGVEIIHSDQATDIVQTEAKPKEQATIHQFNRLKDRVSFIDKNGNPYWGTPLVKLKYSKAMIEQIRLGSTKPHFTHERIIGLLNYIAEKYPDKLIIGGKAGFISYMTKVVNGDMEYTKEEKLESIEDKRKKAVEELDRILANGNQIQWA